MWQIVLHIVLGIFGAVMFLTVWEFVLPFFIRFFRVSNDLKFYREILEKLRIPYVSFTLKPTGRDHIYTYNLTLENCVDRDHWSTHYLTSAKTSIVTLSTFSNKLTEEEFVADVYHTLAYSVLHEVDENFIYKGERIFDPHCVKKTRSYKRPSVYYKSQQNDNCRVVK